MREREALAYRICRKNFSSRAGTSRRGIMVVNFTDQGLKGVGRFSGHMLDVFAFREGLAGGERPDRHHTLEA